MTLCRVSLPAAVRLRLCGETATTCHHALTAPALTALALTAPLHAQTADYVIKHFYPHLEGDDKKYTKLLNEVVERTASLVAKWQLVGFVHGPPPL